MPTKARRSYEAGHRPKFLVVADDSPECAKAVHFAARRAARIGGALVLVAVVEPIDFENWLGVRDVMKAEAEAAMSEILERHAAAARAQSGLEPQKLVRTGPRASEILSLIEEDEDITYLVLASGVGPDGPGPLVSSIAASPNFPIAVVIVPGGLSEAEIEAMS